MSTVSLGLAVTSTRVLRHLESIAIHSDGQTSPLVVGEAQPPPAELLAEDAVLLLGEPERLVNATPGDGR